MNSTKKCSRCKCTKELVEFHRNRARNDGIDNTCKECWKNIRQDPEVKKYSQEYRENNREKLKNHYIVNRLRYKMKKYKACLIDYENKLNNQNRSCAICKSADKKLTIDHNHSTGTFRGLLCRYCNSMLGFAKDDIIILINGIEYLKDCAK